MRRPCVAPRLDGLSRRADFWLLTAILGLSIPSARAQSSVAMRVETTRGGMVADVKVIAKHLDSKSKEVIEMLEISEAAGKYTAERLRKGLYEFIACDRGLKFEPDFNEIRLGENDSKRFTLVLGEQLITQPVVGISPGNKVCLIHTHTGCEATREIDGHGNIQYRGLQEHYHIEPQVCRKE